MQSILSSPHQGKELEARLQNMEGLEVKMENNDVAVGPRTTRSLLKRCSPITGARTAANATNSSVSLQQQHEQALITWVLLVMSCSIFG